MDLIEFDETTIPCEEKPYPNEHACRLKDPNKYTRVRRKNNAARHEGKRIDFIYGIYTSGGEQVVELQAMRYPKSIWNVSDARAHCRSHDGILFEPASEESSKGDNLSYNPDTIETLQVPFEVELKEIKEDGTFQGHASVFGNQDQHNDIVHPGSFEKSLRRTTPKVLWQHDPDEPIGKSLEHYEDKKGLFVHAKLIIGESVPMADKAYSLLRHNVINELSIGFNADPKKQEWEDKPGGKRIRHLKEIDLWEYSLVTFAANARAKVTRVKGITNPRDLERYLREEGNLSWQAARFIAAHVDYEKLAAARDGQLDLDVHLRDGDSEASLLSALAEELRKARPTF